MTKFTNVASLEKCLMETAHAALPRLYMIAAPSDFERRKIIETIVHAVQPDSTVRFCALEAPIEKVIAELNTLSLLGNRPLTILDNPDKLKKNDLAALSDYLARPSLFSFLILSSSPFKGYQELYQKALRKETVFLDLSEEKPWEKEKRLREYLLKESTAQGKTLASDLVSHLLAETGNDMATLNAELSKLIAYTGSRMKMTLEDAKAICASYQTFTGWQLAEEIIWDFPIQNCTSVDTALLIPLIGQLRYHLQVGIQICEGTPPYLKSAQAEKFIKRARVLGSYYFRKGLEALFELELAAKSSGIAPDLLLDIFISKLTLLKKSHASSTSKSS